MGKWRGQVRLVRAHAKISYFLKQRKLVDYCNAVVPLCHFI